MRIVTIIMTFMMLVLGVNFISPIQKLAEETSESSQLASISSMAGILPILFILIIILASVSFMGFAINDIHAKEKRKKIKEITLKVICNSKDIILKFKKASQKYQKFLNNLDILLDVTSITMEHPEFPLTLRDNELLISDEYNWYVADKDPNQYRFKVIGLHKRDREKNKVYIIGRNIEKDLKPYLFNVSIDFLNTDITEIYDHVINLPNT